MALLTNFGAAKSALFPDALIFMPALIPNGSARLHFRAFALVSGLRVMESEHVLRHSPSMPRD